MIKDYEKIIDGIKVSLKNNKLEFSSDAFKRIWEVTDKGLKTISLHDKTSGREWSSALPEAPDCDWELPLSEKSFCNGVLQSLEVESSNDEGFTSKHVRMECRFAYKQEQIELLYVAWLYPCFSGMRTQFYIKRQGNATVSGARQKMPYSRLENIPVAPSGLNRRYFGYHSDTQNRNDVFLDILKEENASHQLKSPEWNTWASVVCLENHAGGIALVKESHKCVNKAGHCTGIFTVSPKSGAANLGWGIMESEIPTGDFAQSWGSWLICWDNASTDREMAFKEFDRLRYPVNLENDIYIQANTWGSTTNSFDARNAASEENVMKEIDVCAELGIDILQIDDGWQVSNENANWIPNENNGWHPHPDKYPRGWKQVVERANEKGVKLGLWAAGQYIPLEALRKNHETGHFVQFKLDFVHFESRKEIEELTSKVRTFIKETGHSARVNWDLTEINPRFGYFFAREYGSIYLENRKPLFPTTVVYRPATVLRDLWQLSKYVNLNKFQCSYQNIDMVDPRLSNAGYYSHAYCLAITLMGIPLFFQEVQLLSEDAKNELLPLIKIYKSVRKELFSGYSYPVGEKPDDKSWTGFQNHNSQTGNGFLMVFREVNNDSEEHSLELRFVKAGKKLKLKNLLSGEETIAEPDDKKRLRLKIPEAPGFLFMKYEKSGA